MNTNSAPHFINIELSQNCYSLILVISFDKLLHYLTNDLQKLHCLWFHPLSSYSMFSQDLILYFYHMCSTNHAPLSLARQILHQTDISQFYPIKHSICFQNYPPLERAITCIFRSTYSSFFCSLVYQFIFFIR